MRVLWLIFIFHTAFAQPGFGHSYLRNSRLCHEWNCVNTKLGLSDSLPAMEHYEAVIKSLLPDGPWQEVVGIALDICYNNRTRRYTNTCPGQALMHCLVDQFIENCPKESVRKDDACSPVTSLAGLNYMFSQSMYENLEKNLAHERRPPWFLRNYFKTKCCRVPPFIHSTLLSQCGFAHFMQYYNHLPQHTNTTASSTITLPSTSSPAPLKTTASEMKLNVVSLKEVAQTQDVIDPLDCCNLDEFIKPSWRSECGFELKWDAKDRLTVVNNPTVTSASPTITPKAARARDVIVQPLSCEEENCVFKNLKIVSESGSVDIPAFIKLLDNFTSWQPEWNKAKARVMTTCLTKPLKEYEAECEINKVLACTFDVLTENCPHAEKHDSCKHSKENAVCQISSSKYRPKNRRERCYLPEIVNQTVLNQCGLHALSRDEKAPETPVVRKNNLMSKYDCKDQTASTTCLMSKMGILNKYGFMDYFKMKDYVWHFTSHHGAWTSLGAVYTSVLTNVPLYGDHCSSPKKLLNLLDAMIRICPITKRKNTLQCEQISKEMALNAAPLIQENLSKEKLNQTLRHFNHVFLPATVTTNNQRARHLMNIVKKPIYDYGILSSKDAPQVEIIDVKPTTRKPLILLPVYMRYPQTQIRYPYGVFRKQRGFWLHNQIARAHLNTPHKPLTNITLKPTSTNPTITTPNPTNVPDVISSPAVDSEIDFQKILPER